MNLKDFIRSIPDYPKKGILFRDITTLIKDEKAFAETINLIVEKSKKYKNLSRMFTDLFSKMSLPTFAAWFIKKLKAPLLIAEAS